MPPRAAKQSKPEAPTVTPAELEAAKEALKSADARKRQNSNMRYYLSSVGKKDAFESMSGQDKKGLLLEVDCTQDISGAWQGTLHIRACGPHLGRV